MRRRLALSLMLLATACQAVTGGFSVGAATPDSGPSNGNGSDSAPTDDGGSLAAPSFTVDDAEVDSGTAPEASAAASDGAADASIAAACTLVTQSNGTGQSYESCAPAGTHTEATATAACDAYALAHGGNASNCAAPWNCNLSSGKSAAVCHGTSDDAGTAGLTCLTYCWVYSGSDIGIVAGCACPWTRKGTW